MDNLDLPNFIIPYSDKQWKYIKPSTKEGNPYKIGGTTLGEQEYDYMIEVIRNNGKIYASHHEQHILKTMQRDGLIKILHAKESIETQETYYIVGISENIYHEMKVFLQSLPSEEGKQATP